MGDHVVQLPRDAAALFENRRLACLFLLLLELPGAGLEEIGTELPDANRVAHEPGRHQDYEWRAELRQRR